MIRRRHADPVRSPPPSGRRGSLVFEAVFGLLILAAAGWLAAECTNRLVQRRRCERFVSDLREIAGAFQRYALEVDGPAVARSASGELPPRLLEMLDATAWRKGSPFGGTYEWVPGVPGGAKPRGALRLEAGAITVTAYHPARPLTLGRRDLLYIDRELDDHDLATGRFRAGFNGWPRYVLAAP